MMTLSTFALIVGLILVVHICIYSIVSRICEAYEKGKMMEKDNLLTEIFKSSDQN